MTEEQITQPIEIAESPKPGRSKRKIVTFSIIVIVLLAVAAFAGWLFLTKPSAAKNKVLGKLPIPIALVDGKAIYLKDISQRMGMTRAIFGEQTSDAEIQNVVLDSLISQKKAESVADSHDVSVAEEEVNQQMAAIKEDYKTANQQEFSAELSKYGIDETIFKDAVLSPSLLLTNLNIWFNKTEDLNKTAYEKIKGIQQQVYEGQSFEALAKEKSEDQASQALEGDLGFVDLNAVLPELKAGLRGAAQGDVKLVVSRYGLHLVKVGEIQEGNESIVHLKQIFVQTSDFEQWLSEQTGNVKVKTIVKI